MLKLLLQMYYLQILTGSTSQANKDWGYIPYIFITIGNTAWALSFIYTNQHNINFAQFTLIRGLVCLLVSYTVCRLTNSPVDFKNANDFKILSFRSICMSFHSFCFALSQFILPLPIVHTIGCSGTLFIFLVDYFMNHVKTNTKQAIGIAIGLFGAIVAINGRILTTLIDPSYKYQTKFQNYITNNPVIITIFSIVFLIAMAIWAVGIVITKKTSANTFQINYILGLALTFSGALAYPYLQNKATKIELFTSIFTTSLPIVIGQWFFIGSLTMTKQTGVLNMMNFWTIFVGYLVSIFRYKESPNLITILGIVLVFAGVWKTIFNKEAQTNKALAISQTKQPK